MTFSPSHLRIINSAADSYFLSVDRFPIICPPVSKL